MAILSSTMRRLRPEGPLTGRAPTRAHHLADEIDATWRRLSRLALWCRSGRLADAELELHEWHRHRDCPQAASVLLAVRLAMRGKSADAIAILRRCERSHQEADPAIGQTFISILTRAGMVDEAQGAVKRLQETHGRDPAVFTWLRLMEAPGNEKLTAEPGSEVGKLAAQLLEQPLLIPTLTAAARLWGADEDVRLLRSAVELAAPDLDGPELPLMVCQAMTDLALTLDDSDGARRWAERGLEIQPYCAALALALVRIAENGRAGGAEVAALERTAVEHPGYPDVQAALIRREAANGHTDKARLHLAEWLHREPDQPVAHQVRKEIAA